MVAASADGKEQLWFLNTLVTMAVGHEQGADGISVVESVGPRGDSAPLHVHRTEDEVFHVLEGEFRFRVGDQDLRAGQGETLLAPKGVPHSYLVESERGRWLAITVHGDFEGFVRSLGRPAERPELPEPSPPPTPEGADALAAAAFKHQIEIVGPPLH